MKNIVFCADGTWCHPQDTASVCGADSNVYKLYKSLSITATQLPHYDDGIGADGSLFRRLFDGAFGEGLFQKIKDGYTKIAHDYEDGDAVFLFGFSRGAFTARSIAGMIAAAGLPDRSTLTQAAIDDSFAAYRLAPQSPERAAAVATLLADHGSRPVPIEMIGVWDTVGALGIPSLLGGIDPARYGFLDTRLSSTVHGAYQALAIDERRMAFPPTLWATDTAPGQILEQVWFSGCHSSVGGGGSGSVLSDIPLAWMLNKAATHGLQIDPALQSSFRPLDANRALEPIEESWRAVPWGLPKPRSVAGDAAVSCAVAARLAALPAYSPQNLSLTPQRTLAGGYRLVQN